MRLQKVLTQILKIVLLVVIAAASFFAVMIIRDAFLTVLAAASASDHWQTTFKHEVADKFSLIIIVVLAFGFVVSSEFAMAKQTTYRSVLKAFARHAAILVFVVFVSHLLRTILGGSGEIELMSWLLLAVEFVGSIGLFVAGIYKKA